MNRRWFLSRLAALGPAVMATPAVVEALAPRRTIFLPPRLAMSGTGWWDANIRGLKDAPRMIIQARIHEADQFGRILDEIPLEACAMRRQARDNMLMCSYHGICLNDPHA